MSRESGIDLEKVTMNLHAGDKEVLSTFYSQLGWSVAARKIIHKYCNVLREKDSQQIRAVAESLDIEIPSIADIKEN